MTNKIRGTWLQAEEYAYPNGGQTRKGAAIFEDGKVRTVWAGIPDTFFTIPAHARAHAHTINVALLLAASRICAFEAEKPNADPVWNRDSHRFASMCQAR